MSIRWISHYWENGPLDCKQRYVLVAIADNANEDGFAYPSIARISKKTLIPERTIQRLIATLERSGWLDRTLRGAEIPMQSGQRATSYQLHRTPKPKGCQNGTPLKAEEGCQNDPSRGAKTTPQGVPKSQPPLIEFLTTNESSGNPKAYTETLSGEKAAKGERKAAVFETPPGNPTPMPSASPPPDWLPLLDRLICASPWGVLRSMQPSDVIPTQRPVVIAAFKHEARESGISKASALEGLLRVVKAQVAALPRDQLRFLGDLETYFRKRNYRIAPEHITGGKSHGFTKGATVEDALRSFIHAERTGCDGAGEDGFAPVSNARTIDADAVRRRLM